MSLAIKQTHILSRIFLQGPVKQEEDVLEREPMQTCVPCLIIYLLSIPSFAWIRTPAFYRRSYSNIFQVLQMGVVAEKEGRLFYCPVLVGFTVFVPR